MGLIKGGAFMGWGGPRSTQKNKKINNYRSILQDFKQFYDIFCFRHIQISLERCSGLPRKIKNKK